jgi:hypothetical protein
MILEECFDAERQSCQSLAKVTNWWKTVGTLRTFRWSTLKEKLTQFKSVNYAHAP